MENRSDQQEEIRKDKKGKRNHTTRRIEKFEAEAIQRRYKHEGEF